MKALSAGALLCAFAVVSHAQVSREFRPPWPPTQQDLQELATVLRTVFDVRTLTVDQESKSLRETDAPEPIRMTEWLFNQLEQPEELRARSPHELVLDTKQRPVLRIFFLKTPGVQFQQELLTTIRTVADVQKIFNVTRQNAIVMRDDRATVDLAAWLIEELDGNAAASPAGYTGVHQFTSAPARLPYARIFYAAGAKEPQFAELMPKVRSRLPAGKAFAMTKPAALVVRGTPGEVDSVAALVGVR